MTIPQDLLRVSLVQTDIVWENPSANLAILEEKLQMLQGQTDVIVLPEMFNTGFSMNEQGVEFGKGPTTQWMQVMSKRLQVLLLGSFKFKEGNLFFNRLLAVEPSGKIHRYDKRHLFRMGAEHEFYAGGQESIIVPYLGWNIAPFICYDLRFPVWSRNVNLRYDLAIYVANWPAARAHAWSTLLKARAIENLAYVVGVNRTGEDGNALAYQGDSAVIHFKGLSLVDMGPMAGIQTQSLSYSDLVQFRTQFPAYLDADDFEIKL
jgi:predicted amidohydrolase